MCAYLGEGFCPIDQVARFHLLDALSKGLFQALVVIVEDFVGTEKLDHFALGQVRGLVEHETAVVNAGLEHPHHRKCIAPRAWSPRGSIPLVVRFERKGTEKLVGLRLHVHGHGGLGLAEICPWMGSFVNLLEGAD